MDYRDILRDHLKKRQDLNPRYSLRSFSLKIGLSPSKVSEVLSGKKKLSVDRLDEVALKLNLKGKEKEIFLASGELESTYSERKLKNKEDLRKKLEKLSRELSAEKTEQRNAWYFGAVKALEEAGLDAMAFSNQLGLTDLQIENAKRFLKRIQRFYPDREEINFEPVSLINKVNQSIEETGNAPQAEFVMLTSEEWADLNSKMRRFIKKYKTNGKTRSAGDLRLVYFGSTQLLGKG